MNMLSHTKIVALEDEQSSIDDSPFDALAETLIDMENEHPELLDSSVFVDLGKRTLGADTTTKYSGDYVEAVAHADRLIVKALDRAGVRYSGEQVIDEDGPRSLALS